MMNDESEQFEQQLKGRPLRQIPVEWRAEILAAARSAQPARRWSPAARYPGLSTLKRQLTNLLWPHPAAWGTLAAVWIFIFAVNFSIRDQAPAFVEKAPSPSPEMVAQLRQQQRMFAELLGVNDSRIADRRKFLPQPRSERIEILTT